MKRDGRRPMRTLGSLTLCRSLLAAGLVDRFRVVVFPVVTGVTGRERVYDGCPDVGLELLESGPSTAGSSCSSTGRPCSTGLRAPADGYGPAGTRCLRPVSRPACSRGRR